MYDYIVSDFGPPQCALLRRRPGLVLAGGSFALSCIFASFLENSIHIRTPRAKDKTTAKAISLAMPK